MTKLLTATNLSKNYGTLNVINIDYLEIEASKITSIVGKSGAGKSTLLHILGTLLAPSTGIVKINGEEVSKLPDNKLSKFRNLNLGFIFQFHHLMAELDILENVCLPAIIANTSTSIYQKKAKEIINLVGLSDRINHKPNQLSGGEQQRVAIARALINNPKIIFADEPTGNLDSNTSQEIHNLFLKLKNDHNYTFVIVTHNQELASLSDCIIEMKDGKTLK